MLKVILRWSPWALSLWALVLVKRDFELVRLDLVAIDRLIVAKQLLFPGFLIGQVTIL